MQLLFIDHKKIKNTCIFMRNKTIKQNQIFMSMITISQPNYRSYLLHIFSCHQRNKALWNSFRQQNVVNTKYGYWFSVDTFLNIFFYFSSYWDKTPTKDISCESTETLKDLRDYVNYFEAVWVTKIRHEILMHQLKTPEIFLFHFHAYLLEIFD